MPSSNCGWSAVEHNNSPGKLGDVSFSDVSSIGVVGVPALCTLEFHVAGREAKPNDIFAIVLDSDKAYSDSYCKSSGSSSRRVLEAQDVLAAALLAQANAKLHIVTCQVEAASIQIDIATT